MTSGHADSAGTARDREMALRLSIGAGRAGLIQQMLVESSLLSAASCLTGVLLALKAGPIGAEIRREAAVLKPAGKAHLLAGVIAGWET